MFIAMNQFQVSVGKGPDFEEVWRKRESYLGKVPGFIQFALLRGDEPGEYISHTTWESREAFLAWAQSDAFRQAHAAKTPEGILATHPRARFYEAAIVERVGEPARASVG